MASHRGVSLIQIHPSPGADAETDIDIIAIHGLDTKSPDTWVWKSKSPDEDINWLASPHMLPGRVGRARIFTCDWPADLFEQPDLIQKTAKVFARLLLAGIKRRPLPKARHKRKKDRPIVFIASCLGGIILMKALLIADHSPSEYTAIRRSTRGIIFLATPFRGTSFQDVANWAEPGLRAWAFIRGQKVSNLLNSVKGSTLHLEELVRRFTQLCQDKDYHCQVTTFYETGMTSLHRKFPLSGLIPSSLLNLFCQPKPLVDSSSATLDIVPHPLPLDRRHVMMNKFKGPEDPDYRCVAAKIEEILHDIRTNSLLDDADAWIRNKHYTPDRLKIERLSGDLLPMDQCYINLALVEHGAQDAGPLKKRDRKPSPSSFFERQKVETPDETLRVELTTIFNQRTGRNGNSIQPRRILIRGRAGVGKTTLCKKIVHEFTQGTWSEWNNLFDRVLWVPLRNLKRRERCDIADYNFEQLFAHEFFSLSSDKSKFASELFLELEMNSSKTLFLLDGLDEVSQDLGEGSMSDFLNELLKQPNIIVTSRPSGKMPPDLDLELETIGFYRDQVKVYIRKVFTNPETYEIDTETVDHIQSFLRNHWIIHGLVHIPIQLDALCYSWKDIRSDLPETMTALYQAIELSLWKKDILRLHKRHYQNPITLGQIQDADRQEVEQIVQDEIFFLESLAFTGLYDDTVEFERKHLNRVSKPIPGFLLNKTIPFLSFLRNSSPSSGHRNGSYHFIHHTFQEYFAARHFIRQWVAGEPLKCVKLNGSGKIDETEPIKFFQKHKYTARYDIMWRFVAGLLDAGKKESTFFSQKLNEFFQKIEEEPVDLLGFAHQRLVMHCLSEVSSDLPFRAELEQRLSKWLLFECKFRQGAHSHLASEAEFPDKALDTAFREGSDDVKRKILQSLTKRATISVSFIEQAASWLEDNAWQLQWGADWPSGQQALLDEILKELAARLKDKDISVRQTAFKIITSQQKYMLPGEILKDVVARLRDEDVSLREAAVTVLSKIFLPSEILRSVAVQLKDKDASVREAAAIILSRKIFLVPNEILKDVAVWLKDEDVFVREAAAKALNLQDMPDEILKCIIAQLGNDNTSVEEATATVLSQQTSFNRIFKYIMARLKDKNVSVQKSATTTLCLMVLPNEALKDIVMQLKDENILIRKNAAEILEQQPALSTEILKAITARLEDNDESVRQAAVQALYWQALPNEILKAIIVLLDNKDVFVQEAAADILSQQPALSNETFETIKARLEDKDQSVRSIAIRALEKQRAIPNEILKVVVARLEDKDRSVRLAAKRTVLQQTALPDEILKVMATQLENENLFVRHVAIITLRRRPTLPDEVFKAMAALLEDGNKNSQIRRAVIRALGRQDLPNEIIRAITAQLEDKDQAIRWASVWALGWQDLPNETIRAITAQLEDKHQDIRWAAVGALGRQTVLPDEILMAVAARLKDENRLIQHAAEFLIRKYGDFYCTLLRGSYITPLYNILFRQSFEEQLSWYIEDGYSCINLPEGIMKCPIDEPDDFRAIIKKAQPADFPAR